MIEDSGSGHITLTAIYPSQDRYEFSQLFCVFNGVGLGVVVEVGVDGTHLFGRSFSHLAQSCNWDFEIRVKSGAVLLIPPSQLKSFRSSYKIALTKRLLFPMTWCILVM